MNNKTYKNRDIRDEIVNKIEGFNKTRDNRIHASERLYEYSDKWDCVFFIMNILAVIFLVLSLTKGESGDSLLISSCFSLYAVILQYYYNTLNYKEKALIFHYQQIELERYIYELKGLLINEDENELKKNYKIILDRYLLSLVGTKNHSSYDNKKVQYDKNTNKKWYLKPIDVSLDNILFWGNVILVGIVAVLYFNII